MVGAAAELVTRLGPARQRGYGVRGLQAQIKAIRAQGRRESSPGCAQPSTSSAGTPAAIGPRCQADSDPGLRRRRRPFVTGVRDLRRGAASLLTALATLR